MATKREYYVEQDERMQAEHQARANRALCEK